MFIVTEWTPFSCMTTIPSYREGYYLVAHQSDPENLTNPYRILREDFKARYVVLAKPFDRALYVRLAGDSRFLLKHEDATSVVFEVD